MKRLVEEEGGKDSVAEWSPEESVGTDEKSGLHLYTYKELFRMAVQGQLQGQNAQWSHKGNGNINSNGNDSFGLGHIGVSIHRDRLEDHMQDIEFIEVFGMEKSVYAKQPEWKKVNQRKKAMLF